LQVEPFPSCRLLQVIEGPNPSIFAAGPLPHLSPIVVAPRGSTVEACSTGEGGCGDLVLSSSHGGMEKQPYTGIVCWGGRSAGSSLFRSNSTCQRLERQPASPRGGGWPFWQRRLVGAVAGGGCAAGSVLMRDLWTPEQRLRVVVEVPSSSRRATAVSAGLRPRPRR
jgi:hypothetical protein